MKPTEQELAKRNMALENAIASQRLEGLESDPQTIQGFVRQGIKFQ